MHNHVIDTPVGTPGRRHGSALVLTMVVVMGVVALVSIAADHMVSSHKLSMLNLDRQRARISAETIAAMVESRLVELASTPNPDSNELENLSRDFQDLRERWWGLRGACYSEGAAYHEADQGLWLNGCVVRWRVEPMRVYAQTLDVQGVASGVFTVNSEPNPDKALERSRAVGDENLSPDDPGFFHFRIVTEAYTLEDPRNGDEKPWMVRSAVRPQVTVQAQRVVQLQLINLFKYALFHAQEDARGDIDLQTGDRLTILRGSVHSNASIYIRGGENEGFIQTPRNYHMMACADDGHNGDSKQFITLGSTAEPIDVVGVNGVFRMGKTANILLGVEDPSKAQYANPLNVPVSEPSGNGDRLNLNGDGAASKRHHLNGVPFILTNDSRSPSQFQEAFQGRARDKNNGGTVVKTLANIPELAGRPLEYQQLATNEDVLFKGGTKYTRVRPSAAAVPLYYVGDPLVSPTVIDDAPGQSKPPLSAEGARLYWNATYTARDVDIPRELAMRTPLLDVDFAGRPLTVDATSTIAATHSFPATSLGDGFDDLEAKGYYLERGLLGRGVSGKTYYETRPATIPKTGLVIRERPRQTILVNGVPGTMARPKLTTGYSAADFTEYRKRYSAYLKSQYVVLFSGRNITEVFFNQILGAVDKAEYPEADFIVTEDEFIDSRESSWMAANYGVVPKDYIGQSVSYRQNVLTLNLRRIQDFLKLTAGTAIDPQFDAALVRTRFNGLIYVHRTRRSTTYHPTESANHAWIAPNGTASNLPFIGRYTLPQVRDPVSGMLSQPTTYDQLTDIREGHGPLETSRCAVRIRGGLKVDGDIPDDDVSEDGRKLHANIDWDYLGGPAPLGNSGLTIITPNRCYLWGDFNTTTRPDDKGKDQVVPCAVFADGITALSANWKDSLWQHYTKWPGDPETTYGASDERFAISTKYITSVVLNNVPNAAWNVSSFGTGGTADTIRLLEKWSDRKFTFRGSMVVLNEQRYSRCGHFYTASKLSHNVRVFETGDVEFTFNTDLLTRNGQPPFSPWGFQVTRVVSTVNVIDQ